MGPFGILIFIDSNHIESEYQGWEERVVPVSRLGIPALTLKIPPAETGWNTPFPSPKTPSQEYVIIVRLR